MKIHLEPAHPHDEVEIQNFLTLILKDTFEKNGLMHLEDVYHREVNEKFKLLRDHYQRVPDRELFVMKDQGRIMATLSLGLANPIFESKLEQTLSELGTFFIHPDYQGLGLARKMIQAVETILKERQTVRYGLDSGYPKAQKIWTHIFGEPTFYLKDFWSKDEHHMIWVIDLK